MKEGRKNDKERVEGREERRKQGRKDWREGGRKERGKKRKD